MDKKFGKIYISGALTHAGEKQRKIYEEIGKISEAFSLIVYIPHLKGTDPLKDAEKSPFEVWKKDHYEVASSDLIIAYVGEPSLGVGGELEIARVTHTEIILWWFKGQKVSRMARGNPYAKIQIEARDEEDLFKKIKSALDNL
jgi:2'-deoxynucleoside 5'-phosphate N-hydrolase